MPWNNANRWNTGSVPSATDDVVIPANTGVIQLVADVNINSLTMEGGLIDAYDTGCPFGWSIDPEGTTASKCYKLFESPLPYYEADYFCNHNNTADSPIPSQDLSGTIDARLMHIRHRNELQVAKRLCRGVDRTSAANTQGCWIGLRDKLGKGKGFFDWLDIGVVGEDSLFLDWRRNEPNNHTISKGNTTNGELCTELIPHQYDPLLLEQGSWNDESCSILKPFICQMYKNTNRYTMTITGNVLITKGVFEGGFMTIGGSDNVFTEFTVLRSSALTLVTGSTSTIGTLYLEDGSSLEAETGAALQTGAYSATEQAFIGEAMSVSTSTASGSLAMQPLVTIVDFAIQRNTVVSAEVTVTGTITIGIDSNMELLQGGTLSGGSLDLQSAASQLLLNGYSSKLSTYDAFELVVANRGKYMGEYYGPDRGDLEFSYLREQSATGVYKLQTTAYTTGAVEVTTCIPFNATGAELIAILDALPSVSSRGGTTIRRYGDAQNVRFKYGYTYRIEMDAPDSIVFASGPLDLSFNCYGLDCGCADTKIPVLSGISGISECTAGEKRSLVDPRACTLTPHIAVSRISSLASISTSGSGSIVINDGVHRLPWKSLVTIKCLSGTGVVGANQIEWLGIESRNIGRIVVAGTGWVAWDSSYVLYLPDWEYARGFVQTLDTAPSFNMQVTNFYLDGLGSILSSCPTSTLYWTTGSWAGGMIGGRVTLFITTLINMIGTDKSLRYSITMHILETAEMIWSTGDISLADGSDMIVDGAMKVESVKSAPVRIGMAVLLDESYIGTKTDTTVTLLERTSGRSWHDYFDRSLPAELKTGWYTNPLCGEECLDTNHLTISKQGTVECQDNSKITFHLPIDLIEDSSLTMGQNVELEMASGGICGNRVIMNIGGNTTLKLSGGQMKMRALCTIQGEGELLSTGGAHDLSFSVESHITIAGGSLIWPEANGNGKTITFRGGLDMQQEGKLIIEPFSTQILILDDVLLKDDCLIQFPLLGIGTQASTFDEQDAPDPTPRGILFATKTMTWEGGTLRGKADFVSEVELFLDVAEKKIESLAKLVNRGHCEWGRGEIITSDQGDFLNFGEIQMRYSESFANMLYEGTELPKKNGGDVFALNYHSYDMDQGALDFSSYVEERTRFVSRAPDDYVPPVRV